MKFCKIKLRGVGGETFAVVSEPDSEGRVQAAWYEGNWTFQCAGGSTFVILEEYDLVPKNQEPSNKTCEPFAPPSKEVKLGTINDHFSQALQELTVRFK